MCSSRQVTRRNPKKSLEIGLPNAFLSFAKFQLDYLQTGGNPKIQSSQDRRRCDRMFKSLYDSLHFSLSNLSIVSLVSPSLKEPALRSQCRALQRREADPNKRENSDGTGNRQNSDCCVRTRGHHVHRNGPNHIVPGARTTARSHGDSAFDERRQAVIQNDEAIWVVGRAESADSPHLG